MRQYIALVHKEADSDYGVSFPDFPGCVTSGSTLQEAAEMAAEALVGHIGVMRDYGDPVPDPSPLDAVMAAPENRGALVMLVPAPEAKAVRINITMPEDVLARLDQAAEAQGETRSGFLVKAVRKAIATT
ncbi:MAG TPA: YlcI/YnfO family protein [Alphaproteobacteria bacterium]|nr:YlcI/YnfO family protein [Alphaproteobacteria bacterium]